MKKSFKMEKSMAGHMMSDVTLNDVANYAKDLEGNTFVKIQINGTFLPIESFDVEPYNGSSRSMLVINVKR